MNDYFKNKKNVLIATLLVVIIVGFIFVSKKNAGIRFPLKDKPASWVLVKQGGINEIEIQSKIKELEKQIPQVKDLGDKYDIEIGISQQYIKLGDGEKAFHSLEKAATILPDKSLAYLNAGSLLSLLGATTSARTLFERGVLKEPQYEQVHFALLNFYRYTPGISDTDIEKAFKEARTRLGENENILKEYASWLEDKKRFADAIVIWEKILVEDPGDTSVIQQKINYLKKKI